MSRKTSFLIYAIFMLQMTVHVKSQSTIPNPDPLRFQTEINTFVKWDQKNSTPTNAILFIGSSSIRMWQTHNSFPDLPIINRGFGGAHISDIIYYYNQVIQQYDADIIIFYCGDNDIAAGKSVEQVIQDYKILIKQILTDMPDVHFIYMPIKPSVSRWHFWDKMNTVNQMIREYNEANDQLDYLDTATVLLNSNGEPDPDLLLTDGLHLNEKGYSLWNTLFIQYFKAMEE
ncbi:GDSL-type esterase/lipase family protein [bacterium]